MRGRPRTLARTPHPDPGIELKLQQIIALRDSIVRRTDLVTQYRKEIGELHYTARDETSSKRIEIYLAEAKALHERILEIEESVPRTNEDIAKLAGELSDQDLAFL